jgi:predicted phosphodiesterase
VGYGPDPAGVVARVRELEIPTVRGNYDDGIGNRRGQCGCYYATEQARLDGSESYAFTDGALTQADHDWLASLPDDLRFEHEGVRILLAHGSPRKINEYLQPDRPESLLVRLAEAARADVVCVGHVHVSYHRVFSSEGGRRIHYVNSGSVGKPKDGDSLAKWVELALGSHTEVESLTTSDPASARAGLGETWLAAILHRASYDAESVARDMRRVGLPPRLADVLVRGDS